jgi:hypothetical protein
VTLTEPDGRGKTLGIVNNTVAFIAHDSAVLSWKAASGEAFSSSLPH